MVCDMIELHRKEIKEIEVLILVFVEDGLRHLDDIYGIARGELS